MKALLSKEEFKQALMDVSDLVYKEDLLCGVLESLTDSAEPVCAFIYSQPIDMILKLLGKMMDDENDEIGYFLYDLDAIDAKDLSVDPNKCPTDPLGGKTPYHDADTLYDYLTGGGK